MTFSVTVSVRTFFKRFDGALTQGEKGLDEAVGLYLWARDHLKELHKVDKKYTQTWAITQIKRVYNIDPEVYIRTAARLGGGLDRQHLEDGRKLIKRFGVYETFRADQLLGPDQMKKVLLQVSGRTGPDQFRKLVDDLHAKEIASLKVQKKTKTTKMDYRAEYLRVSKLLAARDVEIKSLGQRLKDLQKELAWFKKQVKVVKK